MLFQKGPISSGDFWLRPFHEHESSVPLRFARKMWIVNNQKQKSSSGGSIFKNLFVNFKDWMKDDKAMGDYER